MTVNDSGRPPIQVAAPGNLAEARNAATPFGPRAVAWASGLSPQFAAPVGPRGPLSAGPSEASAIQTPAGIVFADVTDNPWVRRIGFGEGELSAGKGAGTLMSTIIPVLSDDSGLLDGQLLREAARLLATQLSSAQVPHLVRACLLSRLLSVPHSHSASSLSALHPAMWAGIRGSEARSSTPKRRRGLHQVPCDCTAVDELLETMSKGGEAASQAEEQLSKLLAADPMCIYGCLWSWWKRNQGPMSALYLSILWKVRATLIGFVTLVLLSLGPVLGAPLILVIIRGLLTDGELGLDSTALEILDWLLAHPTEEDWGKLVAAFVQFFVLWSQSAVFPGLAGAAAMALEQLRYELQMGHGFPAPSPR